MDDGSGDDVPTNERSSDSAPMNARSSDSAPTNAGSSDDAPRPLPRESLPEAAAPEDAQEWQVRRGRIVAAAEPMLRGLAARASLTDVPWSTALGSWWKAAATLAGAAAALLVMIQPRESRPGAGQTLPLTVVAAEGEPFALWEGFGIDADPVLALIAMQEQNR